MSVVAEFVAGFDCTHTNIDKLPRGAQAAGYTTGSGGIPWTAADWKAHPGAVRIDQDPAASDPTADVLDVESGAASPGDCPGWVRRAIADFNSVRRPGQRWPAIYVNGSNIHLVADALAAAKLTGIGLWLAKPGEGKQLAIDQVSHASGPYPLIGVQFAFGQFMDADIWSSAWLAHVSRAKPTLHTHTTSAGDTVAKLAASRHMRIPAWVALQEELGADVPALTAGPLPAGLTWRSQNP